jgi:uncharacterized protein YcbX
MPRRSIRRLDAIAIDALYAATDDALDDQRRSDERRRKELEMTETNSASAGTVAAVWRYPIKSMLGEELGAAEITEGGLLGDRAFALVDSESGKIASAKNPKRWTNLFEFHARYVALPAERASLPAERITFPDGQTPTSDDSDIEQRLSAAVGRAVRLARSPVVGAMAEEYSPDVD